MDPRLAAVALSQAGVFRTAQARVVGGYSPDEIRARLLRGSWVRLRRGVLATAGTVAAARATSDGSFVLSVAAEICARSGLIVASHTAAARLHGFDFLEAVTGQCRSCDRHSRSGPGSIARQSGGASNLLTT
jgi:hypothetical protein